MSTPMPAEHASRRRACGRLAIGLGLGWASLHAAATPAEAQAWMERLREAVRRRNFQGIFVVSSAGGAAHSHRITHYSQGGQQYQRVEALDGERCEVLRHNDLVHTVWPGSGRVLVEQRPALPSFPDLLGSGLEPVLTHYAWQDLGTDRVAGHEARVVGFRPRDGYRFAQRLWTERKTGLLLRADLLAEDGSVLESTAFTELQLGLRPQPELITGPMRRSESLKVLRRPAEPADLGQEGWTLREPPAGFQALRTLRRPAAGPDFGAGPAAGEPMPAWPVLQALFSDGLTQVSMFIEPFQAPAHRREAMMASGATHTLVRRQGDWWLTLVGDVPMPTLRAFALALERRR